MCSPTALIPYVAECTDTDRFIQYCASRCEAEGKKYLGKRFTLRKEAEVHPEKIPALVYQTIEMCKQSLHRGFLWSAKCLSTGHEVSLFGAVHLSTKINKLEYRFSDLYHPLVREKFEQSECLYVELDIPKLTLPERSALFAASIELCKRYLLGKPPGPLSELINRICSMICQLSLGLDIGLIKEAYEVEKPVISLETVNTQVDFITKAPLIGPEDTLDMVDSAQSGNLEQMCDVAKHILESGPTLEERNRNFTSQIKQALKIGQKAMFTFGVAHFIGETGVLKLLSSDPDIQISRIDLP